MAGLSSIEKARQGAFDFQEADEGGSAHALSQRQAVIESKKRLKTLCEELSQESKAYPAQSPERGQLYKEIQSNLDEQSQLEALLQDGFIPQHGPQQLISPRAFFVSPLFRVCSKRLERSRDMSLELKGSLGQVLFRYVGPELRQSDGLVFMALLNLTRDARVGETVQFQAEDLCRTVFKRYDGPARTQLKDHIKRLQRGLIEFERASVQLCMRFDFPARGPWSVALDRDIVRLFKQSPQVWLDLPKRQELPEGLTSWLYSFVESQTKLIPTSVDTLKQLCGSDASEESFPRTLRIALKELVRHNVIDDGWKVAQGMVHWRKHPGTGPAQTPEEGVQA